MVIHTGLSLPSHLPLSAPCLVSVALDRLIWRSLRSDVNAQLVEWSNHGPGLACPDYLIASKFIVPGLDLPFLQFTYGVQSIVLLISHDTEDDRFDRTNKVRFDLILLVSNTNVLLIPTCLLSCSTNSGHIRLG